MVTRILFSTIYSIHIPFRMKRFSILLFCLFLFQNLFAADYYWVGGNGNWTDYSHHWATTSGGNIYHPQIPGPLDNVIIDNKSLSGKTTITLDQTIESCRNFSISASKDSVFLYSNATDPRLSIYGSTSLSPMVKISSSIKLYFESSANETYKQNGATVPCYAIFNNVGSWKITDSINVYSIQLVKGNVDASGVRITTENFTKESVTASVNLTNTKISVSNFYLKKTSDITSGTTIHVLTKKFISVPRITLYGNAIIDSVFCSDKQAYVDLFIYDDATIRYAQMQNCAGLSISGMIDRLDIIDIPTLVNYYGNIGTFNISNAKEIYLEGDLYIDKLAVTGNYNCHNILQIIGDDDDVTKLNINTTLTNFDYCSFAYIDASYKPIMAYNAVDGGNNTGITFSSYALATTLYRIGDGLWSDITKWSYTSNGPPANCIPTVYTDVIFDSHSFTKADNTIDLSYSGSVCKNITIEQINTTLVLDGTLQCAGNFYSAIPLQYDGTSIIFISNNTNTIKFNNISVVNPRLSLVFSGKGTYNLLSDIMCESLENDGSHINTNNYTITSTSQIRLAKGFLNASASKIYSNLFVSKSVNKLDFTTIYVSAYAEFNQNNYGTIVLNGKSNILIDGNFPVKHLKIEKSSVIRGGNISCDSLSVSKGIVVNTSFVNKLEFDYFYNPGVQQCGMYSIVKPIDASILIISSKRNVTFNYFLFENVQATGNVLYTATNSIDGLKNSGITFTTTQAKSLYWIGGSGNWMDATHWSLVSGGVSTQCVPSRNDNVFFDKNSFPNSAPEKIFVDEFVECNNFTFSRDAQVIFTRTESNMSVLNSIDVFGSFSSNNNSTFWVTVNFFGNSPSIVNANHSEFITLVVDKSAKISFTSDLQTNDAYLKNGSVVILI